MSISKARGLICRGRLTYGKSRFVYRYSDRLSYLEFKLATTADLLLYNMTVDDSAIHIGTSISTVATSGHTDSSSPQPLLVHHIVLSISLSFTLNNQRNDSQLSPSLSLQPPSPDPILSHPLSHLYRYMS